MSLRDLVRTIFEKRKHATMEKILYPNVAKVEDAADPRRPRVQL